MAGGKNILAGGKIILAGGKIIFAGGKIISSIMECEEFILPDWSPSDDPARVLAAEGRRNPSNINILISLLYSRLISIQFRFIYSLLM